MLDWFVSCMYNDDGASKKCEYFLIPIMTILLTNQRSSTMSVQLISILDFTVFDNWPRAKLLIWYRTRILYHFHFASMHGSANLFFSNYIHYTQIREIKTTGKLLLFINGVLEDTFFTHHKSSHSLSYIVRTHFLHQSQFDQSYLKSSNIFLTPFSSSFFPTSHFQAQFLPNSAAWGDCCLLAQEFLQLPKLHLVYKNTYNITYSARQRKWKKASWCARIFANY